MSVTTAPLQLRTANVVWSAASDGNLGKQASNADRQAFHDRPWLWLDQVHGGTVVVAQDLAPTGSPADASVTAQADLTLGIATADCAPIALASVEGIIAAVHAGWKGLAGGVLENAVSTMRAMGASEIQAALGPCIHKECYEFGEAQLKHLQDLWGTEVGALTSTGHPSFDLPQAVAVVCEAQGIGLTFVHEACTMCSPKYFSYRKGDAVDRQVMLVWRNS